MAAFFAAFVLGIAYCAPPGLITAEAFRRGLQRGFWAALLLEFGSLIGDATWAMLALAGVTFFTRLAAARIILGLAGSALLFYLAWEALRAARRGMMPDIKKEGQRGHFTEGALLSLTNPFAIAFWLGVSGSVASTAAAGTQTQALTVFFSGFMFAAFVWCFVIAALAAWGRQFLRPSLFRWVDVIAALVLAGFGVNLLWNSISML